MASWRHLHRGQINPSDSNLQTIPNYTKKSKPACSIAPSFSFFCAKAHTATFVNLQREDSRITLPQHAKTAAIAPPIIVRPLLKKKRAKKSVKA
ncbi:hypothetical protein ACHAWX_002019 [Stephanocyclus meneghinianus]